MKKQLIIRNLLSFVLFMLSGFLFISNAADKEKTFNVSKGDMLNVSASNGNVNISIWSKDQAYIKAFNIDEDDLNDLKIEQTGNKVVVDFKGQDSDDFYLEISIPTYMHLDISSGAGNISVSGNAAGKVEIATGGGNINLNDVGDKLSVSTGGGNVSVGNINGESEISTGGGNISIGDAKNKTEVSTGGGNISIGNIGGSGEVSTAGGNISVGKVSGNAELSTAGGNINLDGASGKVETNTAGGNINLKNISGSIEANTAGGNIYAELMPTANSNSEFNTASGDINLKIPSDAKVSIEATVYVAKNLSEADADKLIKSDFEPTNVDFHKNEFIKKFVLNGGGSMIELNTASGKIKISKK
ncbi:MAG TPA: DUF4097 family beta strand repeat-containing protein [Ignavibacteriaceae bacterium]